MDHTKLEITLKSYLDERFNELNQRLHNLELLRQDEHDVVVSMARDISFRSDEISELKKNAVDCKSECMKRKSDFDQRVVAIVEPRIKIATSKLWITIISGAILLLASVTGYLLDQWVMDPMRGHIDKSYQKARR